MTTHNTITAKAVFDKFQMVMLNNIHEVDPDFVFDGNYDPETTEIYQTFLVETNAHGAEHLSQYYPVGWSELLQNWAVGVTHFGTPWEGVTHKVK